MRSKLKTIQGASDIAKGSLSAVLPLGLLPGLLLLLLLGVVRESFEVPFHLIARFG